MIDLVRRSLERARGFPEQSHDLNRHLMILTRKGAIDP